MLGPRFDLEKAVYFSCADLWVNPGLVGLGILDAFCASLPVITTDLPIHSPEIEYLEVGRNGLITKADSLSFSNAIHDLLKNKERLREMKENAFQSAQKYSIEAMVENFAQGIENCLKE